MCYARVSTVVKENLIPVGAWEPQERGLRAALQEGKEAGG